MISSLKELIDYTEQAAAAYPRLADEIRIRWRAEPRRFASELGQQLPGMPRSYLAVLDALDFDGVTIGYFQLAPSCSPSKSLLQRLVDSNDPRVNPLAVEFRRLGVYQVAAWESDPICVARTTATDAAGSVTMMKTVVSAPSAEPLAVDFEELLLIAANLDEIRQKCVSGVDSTSSVRQFREYLERHSHCDLRMRETWFGIAEAVLE